MTKIFGAIEAGGTKFVCATVDHQGNIIRQARIATTTPGKTLGEVLEFFKAGEESIVSLGISSFGPLDLDPASKHYGHITETPKLAWRYCDLLTPLKRLGVPMAIDTDVNGSALGEHVAGAAVGINTFVYFTIGTGIGGGGMVEGRLLHGLSHPEMGHMCIPHDRSVDPFPGACPSHGDCFEGLAAGPAIEKRWGKKAEELPPEHPAWDLEARYIAMALANTIYTLSPKKIILGGGVMEGQFLFPRIRAEVKRINAGYISNPMLSDKIDSFIVPPGLGSRSGIIGSAALAERITAS